MAVLEWDAVGTRTYKTGTDKGVLYVAESGSYPAGVAWDGLTAVTESPSGAETTSIYADNIKYANLVSAEEFGGTIEAYQSPEEFDACDGTLSVGKGLTIGQQSRKTFGFAYRTILGNDTELDDYGYEIHLLYGLTASPSEKSFSTVNDSPEAQTLSWEVTSTPVNVTKEVNGKKAKPTSVITINSTKVPATFLKALEDIIYGTESTSARLPLPDEIIELYTSSAQG